MIADMYVYKHYLFYNLKQYYQNEYHQISTNYSKKYPGKQLQTIDFIHFVDVLWRLRENFDSQSKLEDTWDKYIEYQLLSVETNSNEDTLRL